MPTLDLVGGWMKKGKGKVGLVMVVGSLELGNISVYTATDTSCLANAV